MTENDVDRARRSTRRAVLAVLALSVATATAVSLILGGIGAGVFAFALTSLITAWAYRTAAPAGPASDRDAGADWLQATHLGMIALSLALVGFIARLLTGSEAPNWILPISVGLLLIGLGVITWFRRR